MPVGVIICFVALAKYKKLGFKGINLSARLCIGLAVVLVVIALIATVTPVAAVSNPNS